MRHFVVPVRPPAQIQAAAHLLHQGPSLSVNLALDEKQLLTSSKWRVALDTALP
jgi:hypothetical protein